MCTHKKENKEINENKRRGETALTKSMNEMEIHKKLRSYKKEKGKKGLLSFCHSVKRVWLCTSPIKKRCKK